MRQGERHYNGAQGSLQDGCTPYMTGIEDVDMALVGAIQIQQGGAWSAGMEGCHITPI